MHANFKWSIENIKTSLTALSTALKMVLMIFTFSVSNITVTLNNYMDHADDLY